MMLRPFDRVHVNDFFFEDQYSGAVRSNVICGLHKCSESNFAPYAHQRLFFNNHLSSSELPSSEAGPAFVNS